MAQETILFFPVLWDWITKYDLSLSSRLSMLCKIPLPVIVFIAYLFPRAHIWIYSFGGTPGSCFVKVSKQMANQGQSTLELNFSFSWPPTDWHLKYCSHNSHILEPKSSPRLCSEWFWVNMSDGIYQYFKCWFYNY